MATRPEHGVRYELVRVDGGGPGSLYRGYAHTAHGSLSIEARVDPASGEASASIAPCRSVSSTAARALEKGAAALVRATVKSYLADGREPPRRILRWRERPPGADAAAEPGSTLDAGGAASPVR